MTEQSNLSWCFPIKFSLDGVEMTSSLQENVEQSLDVLFHTLTGERVIFKNYGNDLHSFLFANIDSALISEIETMIYETVLRYEPRVEITNISIQPDSVTASLLKVRLDYQLRDSEQVYSWQRGVDMYDGKGFSV
ncbi:hypothetical protein AND4_05369 [Vibrio sp. AND4]|uniref:GPW/gp25 family protein n=2 Tax=Vibrio sp. AND4 TaxID=314289 RepID=UPI00015F2BEB|nr:hypothetical protein AND4_05369 [Vibrio sp. AND4]